MSFPRGLLAALLLSASLAAVPAFALPLADDASRSEGAASPSPWPAAEFSGDLGRIEGYLAQAKAGKPVSKYGMGWTAYRLLSRLAGMDAGLDAHFRAKNSDVMSYLQWEFAEHPNSEIAAMDALAKEGNEAIRLIARDMLLALKRMPSDKDPPEVQQRDREALGRVLEDLKARLATGTAPAATSL